MAGGWQGQQGQQGQQEQQGGHNGYGYDRYGNDYGYDHSYLYGYGNGYCTLDGYNDYGNGMMQMQLGSTPRVPSYGSTVSLPEIERRPLGSPLSLNGGYKYSGFRDGLGSSSHEFGRIGGGNGPGGNSYDNSPYEAIGSSLGPGTHGRPSLGGNSHGSTSHGGSNDLGESNNLGGSYNIGRSTLGTSNHGGMSLGVNSFGYASLGNNTLGRNNGLRNSGSLLGGSGYTSGYGYSSGMHTRSYTGGESGMVEELPRVVEEEELEEVRALPTLPPIKSWFRG